MDINIFVGIDSDIFECNGPHYKNKDTKIYDKTIIFKGVTNEGDNLFLKSTYVFDNKLLVKQILEESFVLTTRAKKGEQYVIYCYATLFEKVDVISAEANELNYEIEKEEHTKTFARKWDISDIQLIGDEEAAFALRYSIYHLLILGSEKYETSIPARGLSGQTYKGAIFWDTEIFLLPFYTLTNPIIAKKLLKYRINTLPGAKAKAKEFSYDGAFFAWESQDDGLEACSKYNVTDPITFEPIRTYFNEKQIHIDADIAYGLFKYMEVTNDYSLLNEGGYDLLKEIVDFYISYSVYEDGLYHIEDVIGPDEYHERINNNAFSNYLVKFITLKTAELFKKDGICLDLVDKYEHFANNIYLPKMNENSVIEQFDGYFDLEDTTVDIVRSRLKHPREYWGGKAGVATKTRIIKQADVVTLLVLLGDLFDTSIKKANLDYYLPYTEHGSSLSSSMYSLLSSSVGETSYAYDNFLKSASIDLGENQKMYAGGIYIGGTHPASNAGAYLCIVFGFSGLYFLDNKPHINPHLPKEIERIKFKFIYRGEIYRVDIQKDKYLLEKEYD